MKKYVFLLFFGFIFFRIITIADELRILTEEWPPISFTDSTGNVTGLGVEVVKEILEKLDSDTKIEVFPWAYAWNLATTQKNIVLFTTTRTEEREGIFTLLGPVAIGTTDFYAKSDSDIDISSVEDAKKVKLIGVYRSAVEDQILTQLGFENLDYSSLPVFSANKLVHGRIDLWCNANLTVGKILESGGYSLSDVKKVFTIKENLLYIAFSKGTSKEIVLEWQKALEDIKENGDFVEIYKKWLPTEEPPMNTERIGLLK